MNTDFITLLRRLAVLILPMALTLTSSVAGYAHEIVISNFGANGLQGWESKSFKGLTQYQLIQEKGKTVVRATSHNAASGLVKKISFDPKKYRYLRWSWKIDHTIPGGDEKTKAGDDYAARIYVVFSGSFFWQTKAINYIWGNHLKKGEAIPSAFTSNAMMVAVESGQDKTGQWLNEEQDVLADYRHLFGSDPDEASAIAIMTDTDNTGGSAEAWYGDIFLSSERK